MTKYELITTYTVKMHRTRSEHTPWFGWRTVAKDVTASAVEEYLTQHFSSKSYEPESHKNSISFRSIPQWSAHERVRIYNENLGRMTEVNSWQAYEEGLIPKDYIHVKIIPKTTIDSKV
jgi:hypothetical protein